jgi:hypothetical protein
MTWAFATMGTKPGKRMMGQLKGRRQQPSETKKGELNSHNIGSGVQQRMNIMRAFATMSTGVLQLLQPGAIPHV